MTTRLERARKYGTTGRPVRSNASLVLNSPDGWVSGGPTGWDQVGTQAAWWIGLAQEFDGPIGPNGPWPTTGATMPIVTRATSLLVDPLTTGPFRLRIREDAGDLVGRLERAPRWLTDPMLLRPDLRIGPSPLPSPNRLARSVFWRLFVAQAVWWGRSFLYFLEGENGQPLAGTMRIVSASAVEVDDDTGHWRIADLVFDADGRRNGGRLVCLHNPHTDVGVFLQHPEVFSIGRKLANYTAGTFNAGVPAGYLKVTTPNLTQTQADDLKAGWVKAHGGDSRSVAVLNATTDFQAVSWSPVDAALAEVKRLSIADTAYAFGMAPETLGVTMGNSATYSNVAQWFEAHRDFALSPWIGALEGLLSSLVGETQAVEVNLDAYTQPEFSVRMAAYKVAVDAGVLTPDEVRALEGLPPLPEPEPVPAPLALEPAPEPQPAADEEAPDAPA